MAGSNSTTILSTIYPWIKLSRKNALFAGSDGGAEHWAAVASLVETCKLNDVDPLAYLIDVLTRIVNGHPNRDIDHCCPGPTALKPSKPWPENDAYGQYAIIRARGLGVAARSTCPVSQTGNDGTSKGE